MTWETPRKSCIRELNKESQKNEKEALSFQEKQQETIETQEEIEKVIKKIETILWQININVIGLWRNNNLLREINNWNNANENEKNVYVVTWNLIWICRKYMNDPNVTPILDQLQFCMNTLMNKYKIKGEVDWITEAIKSIWDTVKIVYKPTEWWNNWPKWESSFWVRFIYPTQP